MGKYLNTLLLTVFLYYKLYTSMNTTYIHSIAFMFIITHSDFWFIQMLNSHSTNTQANFPLTHIHKIPTHSSTVNAYKNPTRTIRKKSHNSPFETITQHQCAATLPKQPHVPLSFSRATTALFTTIDIQPLGPHLHKSSAHAPCRSL